MHLNPKTPTIKVLVAVRDERGILRFPQSARPAPGIDLRVDTRLPVTTQIVELLDRNFALSKVEVVQDFKDLCRTADGSEAELYLAFAASLEPASDWQTLPELMRALPGDRQRLPFLRAFQVFAGAHRDELRVVEVDDLIKPN